MVANYICIWIDNQNEQPIEPDNPEVEPEPEPEPNPDIPNPEPEPDSPEPEPPISPKPP